MHACGLIHRDIKPGNIIVGDDARPRLVDFGMAVPLGSDSLERVSGTLAYMSPEQARGEFDRIDQRSDIFGLGAVLYELLTGRPPYQGADRNELLESARDGDVTPAIDIDPQLDKHVNRLCMRCLSKDPAARPANVTEVSAAIGKLQRKRRGLYLQLGIAAALLIALGVTVWAFRPQGDLTPSVADSATDAGSASSSDSSSATVTSSAWALSNLPEKHPDDDRPLRKDFGVHVELIGGSQDSSGVVNLVEGDTIEIKIEVQRRCYVKVISVQPDGDYVLFPNAAEPESLVEPGSPRILPGEPSAPGAQQQEIKAQVSRGAEHILVVASTSPWEIGAGEKAGNYVAFQTSEHEAHGESNCEVWCCRKSPRKIKRPYVKL